MRPLRPHRKRALRRTRTLGGGAALRGLCSTFRGMHRLRCGRRARLGTARLQRVAGNGIARRRRRRNRDRDGEHARCAGSVRRDLPRRGRPRRERSDAAESRESVPGRRRLRARGGTRRTGRRTCGRGVRGRRRSRPKSRDVRRRRRPQRSPQSRARCRFGRRSRRRGRHGQRHPVRALRHRHGGGVFVRSQHRRERERRALRGGVAARHPQLRHGRLRRRRAGSTRRRSSGPGACAVSRTRLGCGDRTLRRRRRELLARAKRLFVFRVRGCARSRVRQPCRPVLP